MGHLVNPISFRLGYNRYPINLFVTFQRYLYSYVIYRNEFMSNFFYFYFNRMFNLGQFEFFFLFKKLFKFEQIRSVKFIKLGDIFRRFWIKLLEIKKQILLLSKFAYCNVYSSYFFYYNGWFLFLQNLFSSFCMKFKKRSNFFFKLSNYLGKFKLLNSHILSVTKNLYIFLDLQGHSFNLPFLKKKVFFFRRFLNTLSRPFYFKSMFFRIFNALRGISYKNLRSKQFRFFFRYIKNMGKFRGNFIFYHFFLFKFFRFFQPYKVWVQLKSQVRSRRFLNFKVLFKRFFSILFGFFSNGIKNLKLSSSRFYKLLYFNLFKNPKILVKSKVLGKALRRIFFFQRCTFRRVRKKSFRYLFKFKRYINLSF